MTKPPILEYASSPERRALIRWRRVGIICGIAAVMLLIYRPFSPGGQQARNLAKARGHIPIVLAKIANDPRFDHLTVDEYTDAGGSLLISGEVRSQQELDALKALVRSTNPPTIVVYHVDIYAEPELLKLDAEGASTSRPTTWP